MSYLCSNSGPLVRSIEAAIRPHALFNQSSFKYEEAGDKLVGIFRINAKEYIVKYEGNNIPDSDTLQARINEDIRSLFDQVVAKEKIPHLDISDYIRDNHAKLIDLVQKNDLSEFNMKLLDTNYNYPQIFFRMQYSVNGPIHNWYYDKSEANSLPEFLHAISIDLAIMHQRYAPFASLQRTPFTVGFGPTSVRNIELHIELPPFREHLVAYNVKPTEILDTEKGLIKLKVIYEMGNAFLKAQGREQECKDLSDVVDAKVPVIRNPIN